MPVLDKQSLSKTEVNIIHDIAYKMKSPLRGEGVRLSTVIYCSQFKNWLGCNVSRLCLSASNAA